MATTAKEVKDQVRELLNDTDDAVKTWDDTRHILPFLNAAIKDVTAIRSDAQIASDGTLRTLTPLAGLTANDTVPLHDRWATALVDYVCARCYEIAKGSMENRKRAEYHFARYMREVVS